MKPDRVLDSELDSIIKKMINMKCCQLPGSDNVVEELLSDVESSKGGKLMLKLLLSNLSHRGTGLFFSGGWGAKNLTAQSIARLTLLV